MWYDIQFYDTEVCVVFWLGECVFKTEADCDAYVEELNKSAVHGYYFAEVKQVDYSTHDTMMCHVLGCEPIRFRKF